jgi:peptidoglycan/LPS O-acetylase OafA/YrhL
MSSRERRDDIDGLRCVAVLAVVVFHYAPVWLPGGFVGVDVFFVISGYLISGIVAAQLESDSFSIVSFLARRFLRILPAAYFVIVACLYMSLKWYDGDALLSSTSATMAAVLNVSNEYFYQTVGYFNQNNLTKPLLHT